jgi:hypothetical protein
MQNCIPIGRRNQGRPLKNFRMRETGTGQQGAQLLDSYMMMMIKITLNFTRILVYREGNQV